MCANSTYRKRIRDKNILILCILSCTVKHSKRKKNLSNLWYTFFSFPFNVTLCNYFWNSYDAFAFRDTIYLTSETWSYAGQQQTQQNASGFLLRPIISAAHFLLRGWGVTHGHFPQQRRAVLGGLDGTEAFLKKEGCVHEKGFKWILLPLKTIDNRNLFLLRKFFLNSIYCLC